MMRRHEPGPQRDVLRIMRTQARCEVLGPGIRWIVWTQGCDLACAGCIVPESHDRGAGRSVPVEALARELLSDPVPTGLTLSGGEPFLQPAACARLVEHLRAERPQLSVMAYSGYTIEALRRRSDAGTDQLLAQLDILIDGPYVVRRHAAVAWRGSSNQRMHLLTDRHADLRGASDGPAGLEFSVDEDGSVFLAGVPAIPHARPQIERALASHHDPHGRRRSP
jgi:anaerobic ribonucleoside-triphosphate reductase activating protein